MDINTLSPFERIKLARQLLISIAEDETISRPLTVDINRVVHGLTLEGLMRAAPTETL